MESLADWIIITRAVGIAGIALLLALLLRHRERSLVLDLGRAMVFCLLCYLLSDVFRPASIATQPPLIWYLLAAAAMAIPALYWALARAVFMDDFQWSRREWWVIGIYETIAILSLAADFYWKFGLQREHLGLMGFPILLQAALSLWTLWIIIESWRSDLMEQRRRLRFISALIIGGYILYSLLYELTGVNSAREQLGVLVNTAIITVAVYAALFWFSELQLDKVYHLAIETPPPAAPDGAARDTGNATAENQEFIPDWPAYLERIESERLYALDNMTIAKLAETLAIPEYRLRKQIVQTSAFKNFNQFLNQFRIEEAARRLSSREEQSTPILTIALDVGFRSLPSFNRSFKAHYEMTPSQYRKQADH